jgi:hypothetical protein
MHLVYNIDHIHQFSNEPKSSSFLILRTRGSTILSCGARLEWNFMLDKTIRKGEITWQMLTLMFFIKAFVRIYI